MTDHDQRTMVRDTVRNIHMMGICGMGMGSLALLLQSLGYHIRGSDENIYPPMSTQLRAKGIEIIEGYRPENLVPRPDLVIVGNVIRKTNPEAEALIRSDIPYCSMAEALKEFFLRDKSPVVIAGTHGKSTTSTLATWVMITAGLDPGAFIGAVSLNWGSSYRIGSGKYFVVEGDEYDTAFFDKTSKFFHYLPRIVILTSVEFDHADIFRDFKMVKNAFEKFLKQVPDDGVIIANWSDETVKELLSGVKGPEVLKFGEQGGLDSVLRSYSIKDGKTMFDIEYSLGSDQMRNETFITGLYGRHNLFNIMSVRLLAGYLGISKDEFQRALDTFRGLKRRQEIVGEADGVLVIDDFAHHPTAVRETISAIKESHRKRRLLAVFEPRSNSSRRKIFQNEYERAFNDADVVCIKEPPERGDLRSDEKLDTRKIIDTIQKSGKETYLFEDFDTLLQFLLDYTVKGDVVLFMSNGAFDLLPKRLFEYLVKRSMK